MATPEDTHESILPKYKSLDSISILITGSATSGKSALTNGILGVEKATECINVTISRSYTLTVKEYAAKRDKINITVWDAPGLQNDTNSDNQYLKEMKSKCQNRDLTIFCVKATPAKFIAEENNPNVVAMEKLTKKFGIEFWQSTIIALTFSNVLNAMHSEWEYLSREDKAAAFQATIQQIEKVIKEALVCCVKVPEDLVRTIKVIPAGHYKKPQLPGCEDWVSVLWSHCISVSQERASGKQVIAPRRRATIGWRKKRSQSESHEVEEYVQVIMMKKQLKEAEKKIKELNSMLAFVAVARQQKTEAEQHAALARQQKAEAEQQVADANRKVLELTAQNNRLSGDLQRMERRVQLAEQRCAYDLETQWVVQRRDIDVTERQLGGGGWGFVKVAKFRGIEVAAKSLYKNIRFGYYKRLFIREMNMAARLRHPNLVQFIGATLEGEMIILTELMHTSLRRVLEQGRISREHTVSISVQVCQALNYLHLMQPDPVIHRDISSANVLLNPLPNNGWLAKVTDYGSVNILRSVRTENPGNPVYAAPEARVPSLQSTKMDIFSVGVLLIEMVTGQFPSDDECESLFYTITDRPFAVLIKRCIDQDKDKRPTAAELLHELQQL